MLSQYAGLLTLPADAVAAVLGQHAFNGWRQRNGREQTLWPEAMARIRPSPLNASEAMGRPAQDSSVTG